MNRYRIIPADLIGNKSDIISIINRNLTGNFEDSFDWKYINSPSGKAECRLAQEETGRLYVGSAAIFKRTLYFNGKKIPGGVNGDFSVDREHRGFGPAMALLKDLLSGSSEEEACSLLYVNPNNVSRMVFQRAGYSKMGEFRRYIKILRNNYRDGKRISNFNIVSNAIDFALKLSSSERRYKRRQGVQSELLDSFDHRFESVNCTNGRKGLLIGDRDLKFLNWRYIQSPLKNYRIFSLSEKNTTRVIGYVVFYIEKNMASIADIQWIGNDCFPDELFSEFILFMRDMHIGSIDIRYFGSTSFIKKLESFGFTFHQKASTDIMAYINKNGKEIHMLLNREYWHVFEGDFD